MCIIEEKQGGHDLPRNGNSFPEKTFKKVIDIETHGVIIRTRQRRGHNVPEIGKPFPEKKTTS